MHGGWERGEGGVNVGENRSFGNVQFCTFACRPVNILHINVQSEGSRIEKHSRKCMVIDIPELLNLAVRYVRTCSLFRSVQQMKSDFSYCTEILFSQGPEQSESRKLQNER